MKRFASVILTSILFLTLVACSSTEQVTYDKNGEDFKAVSIENVLNLIKNNIDTVISVEVGTEENDSNKLLGKDNGYIELGWFVDNRIIDEQSNEVNFETSNGGTLEKFSNIDDAIARHEYLSKFRGFLSSYSEVFGVWVIRLSNKLSDEQQISLSEKIKNTIEMFVYDSSEVKTESTTVLETTGRIEETTTEEVIEETQEQVPVVDLTEGQVEIPYFPYEPELVDEFIEEPYVEEAMIVYITPTGSKYHYKNPCGNGSYSSVTIDEALQRGLKPCEKCVLH